METQKTERRINRSDNIHVALSLQLAASAERAGFHAVVLADEDGFVFATGGNRDICEEMAAQSPELADGMKPWHGTLDTRSGEVLFSVTPLRIGERVFYLSMAEGDTFHILKEIRESSSGVSRILH